MSEQRRLTILVGIMLAMMLAAAGWFTLEMLNHHSAAARAAEDLANCRLLAEQIKSLRNQSAMASDQDEAGVQQDRLVEQINAAADKAGLTGQWQDSIEHRREMRVGDTPYLRKPAVLITRGLTLAKLTALIHHLTYDSPYTAEKILLRTPPGDESGGAWDADITLTYLIYSPQTSQGQGR